MLGAADVTMDRVLAGEAEGLTDGNMLGKSEGWIEDASDREAEGSVDSIELVALGWTIVGASVGETEGFIDGDMLGKSEE